MVISSSPEISKPVRKKRVMHPNSLANLKPYAPGTNGHQGGYSLLARLKHTMEKPLVKPSDKAPVGEHIVYETLQGALAHEPTPFKEVWDRLEGKLTQDVALSGGITINLVSKIPRPDDKPSN